MNEFDPNSMANEPPLKRGAKSARGSVDSAPEEVALTQFTNALGAMSVNLQFVAGQAVRFANLDGDELVIDIAGLVSAMLIARTGSRLPTAVEWLQQWGEEQRLAFVFRAEPDFSDRPIVLSASLLRTVLPRAIALRDTTMGTTPEPVGLRHVLFALAERQATQWPPLQNGGHVAPERLLALRKMIVERTARFPMEGEDMDVWQALIDAPPLPSEATPLLSDNPADADTLGRQPLADALAARLVRLQAGEAASSDPRAVMVHLHGAWGSGKSSMVRFLGAELAKQNPPWLVVEFNAWRNARVKPPWWNMLTEFKREISRRQLQQAALIRWIIADPALLRWIWLQIRWWWVSPTVDNFVPIAGIFALVLLLLSGGQLEPLLAALNIGSGGKVAQWFKDVPQQVTLATGLIAATVTVVRSVLFGGKRVAESFDALRTDSFRPFIGLFDMLVSASPAPVLIVLDDLDRCDAGTVTDLLEGIQTLFRGQPVVFLAVADRHWITTSFGERFKLFEAAGDKARPIGDLFLDKMFQLSVPVPALPDKTKRAYLGALLGREAAPAAAAAILPETAISHESIQAAIAAADDDAQPALRAQAVARLSTARADKVIEHRLLRWADHVEPNPRGMKRLVNAIGMAQARSFLEGRDVAFDTIVLWTIVELRWPRAADTIARNPALIDHEDSGPDPLLAAWADPVFRRLAGELDAAQVRAMLGIEAEELAA